METNTPILVGNVPNLTQEGRVLEVLKKARDGWVYGDLVQGGWVSKRYFIEVMKLTQSGRAIHNLENAPRWEKEMFGWRIEHSDFSDSFGFKSYRLLSKETLF